MNGNNLIAPKEDEINETGQEKIDGQISKEVLSSINASTTKHLSCQQCKVEHACYVKKKLRDNPNESQEQRTKEEERDRPNDVSGVGKVGFPDHCPDHPQREDECSEVEERSKENDAAVAAFKDCKNNAEWTMK